MMITVNNVQMTTREPTGTANTGFPCSHKNECNSPTSHLSGYGKTPRVPRGTPGDPGGLRESRTTPCWVSPWYPLANVPSLSRVRGYDRNFGHFITPLLKSLCYDAIVARSIKRYGSSLYWNQWYMGRFLTEKKSVQRPLLTKIISNFFFKFPQGDFTCVPNFMLKSLLNSSQNFSLYSENVLCRLTPVVSTDSGNWFSRFLGWWGVGVKILNDEM